MAMAARKQRISRRRFLGLAIAGSTALGVASVALNPTAAIWRRIWDRLRREWDLRFPAGALDVPGQSDVYRVDNVPAMSWLPANHGQADWQARHAGIDALLGLMGGHGLKFYQSQTAAELGDADGLIAAQDVVLLKVNAQWAARGMTNTDVVRGVVRAILDHPDGFSGEIVVVENSQGYNHHLADTDTNNDDSAAHSQSFQSVVDLFAKQGHRVSLFAWSALRNQVRDWDEGDGQDGYVAAGPYPLNYPKFTTAFGTHISLKHGVWDGKRYDAQRLKFINMPVLKSHAWFGVTASVKNYLGVMSKWAGAEEVGIDPDTYSFHVALYETYNGLPPGLPGSVMALRFPTLTLLDAIYTPTLGNRTQDASYEATPRQGTLLASLDPVALDYYASKYVLLPLQRATGAPRSQLESADPDLGNMFRRYLLAAQARLLENGHVARFGDRSINLVQKA
jgi:uncharacterized protein (DUF362 family)